MYDITYVTAFLHLNRENWETFPRSVDTYFNHFAPFLKLFKKDLYRTSQLLIYLDDQFLNRIGALDRASGALNGALPENIKIIPINKQSLKSLSPLWGRLEREREIMESKEYKERFAHRMRFPENTIPEYTLINHAKIDFVSDAVKREKDCEYFCWVDFGYFQNENRIPENPLDLSLFGKGKINYTLINPLDLSDMDVIFTMNNAPEKIGGFFFLGDRVSIEKYQKLYHKTHEWFQKEGLADDDQHLALRCYFTEPSLFCLHNLGGWHKALLEFQQKL